MTESMFPPCAQILFQLFGITQHIKRHHKKKIIGNRRGYERLSGIIFVLGAAEIQMTKAYNGHGHRFGGILFMANSFFEA
ncbi:MAG: hypothetical protein KJ958_12420 [Gammaproteobacteria bacterium]|nr:hypothetical protein [Gammaproteobacteria bacterium]MBU1979962.1 hypothetical protein [Gammaproteobacteria bacterium]